MPAKSKDQVVVVCPHCGHPQAEPRPAFSSICKKCGQHLRVQEILNPPPRVEVAAPKQRHITCFECGAGLEVPASAASTMCKWCSGYVDLHDYRITTAMAKNFKTKGLLQVELKGYLFNTESIAGEAVIRGKYHGKLTVEHALTIYSTADIKGSLAVGRLIIPEENHFRWAEPIQVGSAEIAGEFTGHLRAQGSVVLKATARMFGPVEARQLVVEAGAVVVGKLRIGAREGQQVML